MTKLRILLAAAVAAIALSNPASASSYLTNGSFETTDANLDPVGWTTGGNFTSSGVVSGPWYTYSSAQDGINYLVVGPVGPPDGTLSQSFADVAGETLQISGWYAAAGDSRPDQGEVSDLSASFNATSLLSLNNPDTGSVWTQFSFDVTATGFDTFSLAFRDDLGWIALDNFSVTTATTPLPAALPLFATGLGAIGLVGVAQEAQERPCHRSRLINSPDRGFRRDRSLFVIACNADSLTTPEIVLGSGQKLSMLA